MQEAKAGQAPAKQTLQDSPSAASPPMRTTSYADDLRKTLRRGGASRLDLMQPAEPENAPNTDTDSGVSLEHATEVQKCKRVLCIANYVARNLYRCHQKSC